MVRRGVRMMVMMIVVRLVLRDGEDYVDCGGEDDGDGEVCGDKDGSHTSPYEPVPVY